MLLKKLILVVLLWQTYGVAVAQELFPVAEPASSVPKGALGVRVFDEGYQEKSLYRNVAAIKLMYGLTSKLSVYVTADVSDIHAKTLPFDFISHDHSGGTLVSGTNTPKQGVEYQYVFNSVDLYAKYRFLSVDGTNSHFRMAAYAEGSYVAVPSHEAEPNLLIHTSGVGAGIITTYLKHHFAVSLTTGCILPFDYKGNTYDIFGGVYPTTIKYGNAVSYDLSFGYLLFPRSYKNYDQTNWNIYCELIGKSYGAAKVREQDGPFPGAIVYELSNSTPILKAGNYIDITPGIQCILKSTYRIDFSVAFPLINRSYNHLYPVYMLGLQRYFYFGKHGDKKNG